MLTEKVRRALAFAIERHAGQKRKHDLEYVFHPQEIAGLLLFRYGVESEEILCAALLHDVIEESGVSRKELTELFGERVAAMVEALSRDKTRPYRDYAQKLADAEEGVLLIKGVDMLANLRDSTLADEALRSRVIRRGRLFILPHLAERLDSNHPLVRDLSALLDEVEGKEISAPRKNDAPTKPTGGKNRRA